MHAIARAAKQVSVSFDRLRQATIIQLLKKAAEDWYEGKTFMLGAALAFYAVFAIAPVLLMTIAIASLILGKEAAQVQLAQRIADAVGPTVAQAIESTLSYAYSSGSGTTATIISCVLLLFAATGLFSQLQDALNTIWDVKPKPGRGLLGVLKDRFWSFVMVLVIGALLLCLLVVHAVVLSVGRFVHASQVPGSLLVWHALDLAVSFVFLTLLVAMVYQVLPDVRIAWRDVWVGAGLTALLFLLGNYLISLYLNRSATASAYGAAGSFVVILLWVYYASQILLFGAEFTQVYAKRSRRPIEPADNAVVVARS